MEKGFYNIPHFTSKAPVNKRERINGHCVQLPLFGHVGVRCRRRVVSSIWCSKMLLSVVDWNECSIHSLVPSPAGAPSIHPLASGPVFVYTMWVFWFWVWNAVDGCCTKCRTSWKYSGVVLDGNLKYSWTPFSSQSLTDIHLNQKRTLGSRRRQQSETVRWKSLLGKNNKWKWVAVVATRVVCCGTVCYLQANGQRGQKESVGEQWGLKNHQN